MGWAEEIGIHPRIGTGVHWKAADGQFERLMRRWVVPRPKEVHNVVPKDKPKMSCWDVGPRTRGSSTLVLYTAGECIAKPPCNLRSGRSDLAVRVYRRDGEALQLDRILQATDTLSSPVLPGFSTPVAFLFRFIGVVRPR